MPGLSALRTVTHTQKMSLLAPVSQAGPRHMLFLKSQIRNPVCSNTQRQIGLQVTAPVRLPNREPRCSKRMRAEKATSGILSRSPHEHPQPWGFAWISAADHSSNAVLPGSQLTLGSTEHTVQPDRGRQQMSYRSDPAECQKEME